MRTGRRGLQRKRDRREMDADKGRTGSDQPVQQGGADGENVAALKNNKWSLQRSIHEMQKYFVKNFPEYLDRE